jgi:predicted ArsR family transcriptional regulator
MKAYRLAAWPDLPRHYQRTAHRRMLGEMSQRHVTLSQLARRSGLQREQVRAFLEMLETRGLLSMRDASVLDRLAEPLRRVLSRWNRG